jgi:hypothetical protein
MAAPIVSLGYAPVARAEEPDPRPVEVSPPACKSGELPMVPFLDSLRVELSGRALACCTLVEAGKGAVQSSIRVALELDPCVADGDQVRVAVHDQGSGSAIERDVSLADVAPSARPRALALAVAELIRALAQPAPPAPPSPKPLSPQATPEEVASPVSAPRGAATSIHLEGELRALPTRDTTLWGGRVRLSAPWRGFHADIDVGVGFASAHDGLGDVFLRTASMGFGIGPRWATAVAIVDVGPRAEAGWAWILGEPGWSGVRTGAGSEWTACAGLRGAIQVPAAMALRPSLGVEGGFVLHGVKGESNNQPVMGMTGYYLLAALGLAVSP